VGRGGRAAPPRAPLACAHLPVDGRVGADGDVRDVEDLRPRRRRRADRVSVRPVPGRSARGGGAVARRARTRQRRSPLRCRRAARRMRPRGGLIGLVRVPKASHAPRRARAVAGGARPGATESRSPPAGPTGFSLHWVKWKSSSARRRAPAAPAAASSSATRTGRGPARFAGIWRGAMVAGAWTGVVRALGYVIPPAQRGGGAPGLCGAVARRVARRGCSPRRRHRCRLARRPRLWPPRAARTLRGEVPSAVIYSGTGQEPPLDGAPGGPGGRPPLASASGCRAPCPAGRGARARRGRAQNSTGRAPRAKGKQGARPGAAARQSGARRGPKTGALGGHARPQGRKKESKNGRGKQGGGSTGGREDARARMRPAPGAHARVQPRGPAPPAALAPLPRGAWPIHMREGWGGWGRGAARAAQRGT
jgi:hypothetical protein